MKRLVLGSVALVFSVACSDSSESSPPPGARADASDVAQDAGGDAATAATRVHGVLVIGPLAAASVDEAKQAHDAVAAGGQERAIAAGDIGHAALLGADALGTRPNELLAFDRWRSNDNLDAFYADPQVAAGFGQLFSAPPTRGVYVAADGWASWGALEQEAGRYWVVVRGVLREKDPQKAQAAHDAVAKGGEQAARAAGDRAHVVFVGRDDGAQFLAFDVWTDLAALQTFYANPQIQQGFGSLFEAPPTLGVYATTTFHQW